ncbi:16S rRNA (adenine(1518)-N(6)/adenine(1519)-N(6))-dimethyltransferase RsmA [bacterium]|nr:16S rRNA (adenine(1518)-N(6)/adenine(1519)-N(6))-dimethyltransferase RsmA [bacterium]
MAAAKKHKPGKPSPSSEHDPGKDHDDLNRSPDTVGESVMSPEELERVLAGMRTAGSAIDEEDPRERLASPIGYTRKHGGLPPTKKSLGQNWLVDPDTTRAIAAALRASEGDLVVEIGPGTGALTEVLLENGYRVVALEIDRRMVDVLAERWPDHDRLTVIHADVMKADLSEITNGEPFCIVGNLPYNITSSLIFKLLEQFRTHPALISRIVILLQYEVALRLTAQPGASKASVLSLLLRYWGEPELALQVPKEVFQPMPKVDAGLLAMDISPEPLHPVDHWPTLLRLVKGTFAKRRKMLRNSVPGIVGLRPIEGIEFDWTRRPQTLSAADYAWLAEQLAPKHER